MTARQPRRTRRRVNAPAAALPRPVAGEADVRPASRRSVPAHHREHHVTRDYSHVRKDLVTIGIFGALTTAFIVAMAFVL